MAYFSCTRCKSTDITDPSIKTMTNECGHAICERCIEIVFARGVGNCASCGMTLKRNNFRAQKFKDPMVERYNYVRDKYMKDFILFETDFATYKEYDIYLGEVEEIAYNLTSYKDVEGMMKRIEKFKQENQEAIKKNKGKKDPKLVALLDEIESEKTKKEEFWRCEYDKESREKERKRVDSFNGLPQQLPSNQPTNEVVEERKPTNQTLMFSTRIPIGNQETRVRAVPVADMGMRVEYQPLELKSEGPEVFEESSLRSLGYLNNVRGVKPEEMAGGFLPEIFCTRALTDAFNGLFVFVDGKF